MILYTMKRVAELYGISAGAVQKLIARKKLTYRSDERTGQKGIPEEEVLKYLEGRKRGRPGYSVNVEEIGQLIDYNLDGEFGVGDEEDHRFED